MAGDQSASYQWDTSDLTSSSPHLGIKNLPELFNDRNNVRTAFNGHHDRPVHDCRHEVIKNHTDPRKFETLLLAQRLTETASAVTVLHSNPKQVIADSKTPHKLLYKLSAGGNPEGEFQYPRGVCITVKGDIIVADTNNHRILQFTQFCVFIKQFGKYGTQDGEFDKPCGVIELPDGDIAVADSKNNRLQVFTDMFVYKYQIQLPHHGLPYSLSCSGEMDVVVATTTKRLLVLSVCDKSLTRSFYVGSSIKSKCCPLHVAMTFDSKAVVSDPEDNCIYVYTLCGELLTHFSPEAHTSGLALTVGGLCVTPFGEILLVDTLNHVVNLYTDKGEFLQQILSPKDDAGAIHSLALGSEGHLAVTEFSVGGHHCIKIFRYSECQCHGRLLPAKKRRKSCTVLG